MIQFADTEQVLKAWLPTTTVGPLIRRTDGGYSVFMAMPAASPLPAVIITQIAGGPDAAKDLPQQTVRVQFDCWGKSRQQAGDIARALMAELEWVPRNGGAIVQGAYLGACAVQMMRWLPDPDSDTPRYIVDALITTVL
jgi:hypothetical protein